jgi:cell wall-associated hydrolases (invasion-associated proteins)
MKRKILTLASALTLVSLCSFNAYADMDLETSNAVSGMAVALNNYKASSISPQTALGESLKEATTNTIEITGADDARTKLVNDTVKYEAPSIQDKLKEDIIKDDIVVANRKKDTVVHSSAKETGEAVGSISYSSVATVVGTEVNESGEWLKINSGSVEGYVKASEVATGEKAKKMAKDAIVTYATVVDIDNVRLRTTPNITSNTLTMLGGGEKFVVVGQDNNFVKVQVDDDLTGYVYKDFIKTDISYKTAKTTEESTIEALEKAKLETEAKEAMDIYQNLVDADGDKTIAAKKNTVVEDTTKAKETKKSTEATEKTTSEKTGTEPKTIKSPAAEKRETPASKEVNINVPDTIKGTSKANEEKSEAPKETTKQPETTLKPTSKPTEDATKQSTKAETNADTVEATKNSEEKKVSETIKAIEDTKKETESSKVTIETVKEPEETKIPETTKQTETVQEKIDAVQAPETISAVEDTTKQTEATTVAEQPQTKPAESKVEISTQATTAAGYGPGGNTEKSKETETKAKKVQKERSVVTGENGGPGVSKSKATTEATTESTKAAAKEKASRSAIVAYAKQYVGNPYVYGGTSLTNGADCSGFVMRVYEKFGISTGRNTRQQANNGREISVSEVQPGDLLFYGSGGEISHVGIYMGDGKIVHAANKNLGITIGRSDYRTPIKAVTFLR